MRCTPFIVNTKFWVLICIECEHAVAPSSAITHLHDHHSQCKPPSTFKQQLESQYPKLKDELIHPGKDIPPVFGLRVWPNYRICTKCLHGYRSAESFRKHPCSAEDFYESHVQTFFAGLRRCYFPITVDQDKGGGGATATGHYDIFTLQQRKAKKDLATPEGSVTEDHRQLLQFLRKEGWISHVQGFSLQDLADLVQAPEVDEPFQGLGTQVYQVMDRMQSSIDSSGYLLRRLIGRRPSYVPF